MTSAYTSHTSRIEVADAVSDAFGGRPLTRDLLIEHARGTHASREVLLALASLPEDKRYAGLRELWPDLPDMPVEA